MPELPRHELMHPQPRPGYGAEIAPPGYESEPGAILPAGARELFDADKAAAEDAYAALSAQMGRVAEARTALRDARAETARLEEALSPRVATNDARIAAAQEAAGRAERKVEGAIGRERELSSSWQELARGVENVTRYLEQLRAAGVTPAAHEGSPGRLDGFQLADVHAQLDEVDRNVAEVQRAPKPMAERAAAIRKTVADRAAGVWRALEDLAYGRVDQFRFPMTPVTPPMRELRGLEGAPGTYDDALAVGAFKDQEGMTQSLLDGLNQIYARMPLEPLTDAEREARLAELAAERLGLERVEVEICRAQRVPLRADIDPRARLGLNSGLPPYDPRA